MERLTGRATLSGLAMVVLLLAGCEEKQVALLDKSNARLSAPDDTAGPSSSSDSNAANGERTINPDADPVIRIPADDPEMEAAKARARAELPGFLARLGVPPPGTSDYQVKFDLVPGDVIEFIWATDLKWDGNRLTGRLGNKPEMPGYAIDQQMAIPLGDIIDWGYVKNGRMEGHYTTAVLLNHLPPEQAAEVRSTLGWQ